MSRPDHTPSQHEEGLEKQDACIDHADSCERAHEVAKEKIEETPDIREARVAALKQALQEGTLDIDAEKVAEKMLNDPQHQIDTDK